MSDLEQTQSGEQRAGAPCVRHLGEHFFHRNGIGGTRLPLGSATKGLIILSRRIRRPEITRQSPKHRVIRKSPSGARVEPRPLRTLGPSKTGAFARASYAPFGPHGAAWGGGWCIGPCHAACSSGFGCVPFSGSLYDRRWKRSALREPEGRNIDSLSRGAFATRSEKAATWR